ncbi:hypothetical protein EZ449_12835 [Pedobacter frigidisoli]|uniref:Uncharacterized protein n=1 Tax=Pedobacter frigidisoli TaxID=2530455 RepID=A0A4R0NZE4_9SPHI|nr:hypothetical protein [Pedobacter frigidisoli]TCD08285.1 hypothetical protein EZ449_12835 [Pedobacter frigidisoli]
MIEKKKQQAIKLLKQGLETVEEREYTEIAEVPTTDEDKFEVKYSFVHDGLEGIFTVVGQAANVDSDSEEEKIKVTLFSEFAEDSLHYDSATAKEQVDNDLINVEEYMHRHINEG